MPDRRPTVVVMVKVPVAGRVKTRLGRDMGMTAAAWWFRHQSQRVLRNLQDPRWRLVLAVSPDRAGMVFRRWPGALRRMPQGPGDLGDRMARIFRSLGPGRAVLVGADIPGITARHISDALQALGQADAVIGPATDGGYWLVGFRHPARLPAGAFRLVRWSGRHARGDTAESLRGLRLVETHMLGDVDSIADLRRAKRR